MLFFGPPSPRFLSRLIPALALLGCGGCAQTGYAPRPLTPEKTAAAFDGRSLSDPGLRRFLAENLDRDVSVSAPSEWDFEPLAWVAFYYNPALDVARAQWESARAGVRTASARPNPSLGLTPGYSTNPGSGVSPWFPAVTFDFPLETAGKRGRRAQAAELTAEAARQAVFTAAWKVRSELRRALLDLALAGPRAEHLHAQVALQQHTAALLEQRLNAGAIAAPELATARLAAVRAEAAAADADRQVPLARQRVTTALGLPASALADIRLPVPETVPPFSTAQLMAARRQSLQSRADVLAALARYDASEAALALEVARQYPDVHLGPGYQWDQGQNKWTIGVSFELPLFHRNEGPIGEAVAHRREAAAQFVATQAQALAEIDAAASAQAAAAAQLELLRRVEAQLREQRTRTEIRQRAGAADELEAAGAELEVETGALAVADAEAQAALAAGQLEDALQVPFAHLSALEKPAATASSSSSSLP